jgi:DNA helicase-2/ATP-dependent DNA helicase PcrA
MLSIYNPEQLQAVLHGKGPLLVLAGAGTGKTAVITGRITRLILEEKVPAEKILALTFTEKAAREMQQRVDELLPYGMVQTQIMTFHGLSDRLLREYALDIGLNPDYQIASSAQSSILMQEIVGKMTLSYYSSGHHPFVFTQALLASIGRLKDEGIMPSEFIELIKKPDIQSEEDLKTKYQELGEAYVLYQKACIKHNMLDYGDLLIYLQQLLQKRRAIQREIADRYEYILVDEFQDTNKVQMQLLELLLSKQKSLMVVGDDDQAIYKFRGASVENILGFQEKFPDSKLIVLTKNYRSGQSILDASYRLIQHNNPDRLESLRKIDKQLHSQTGKKATVEYHAHQHRIDEQSWLIEKIKELIKNGTESKNIAILLRKNGQAKPFVQQLSKNNIPYYVHQSLDLFSQKPVKTLLALCACLADPGDNQAAYQLLGSPLFSIPSETLILLSSKASALHIGLEDYIQAETPADDPARAVIAAVIDWRAMGKDLGAGELIYVILKKSGYLPNLLKKAAEDNAAAIEVQLVAEFFEIVKEFELSSEFIHIASFYDFIRQVRRSEVDLFAEISPLDIEGVQILTVHRAKGLEFEHVFLPELVEQTFPTYARAETIKLSDIFEGSAGDHYQEERRLFYVAMTRAMQGLYLSNASDYGGKRAKRASRFIAEALGPQSSVQAAPQTNFADFVESFAPVAQQAHESHITAHLYNDGWLRLSTNQIADYLRSPREFWLFQVLKMPKGPYHALVYGSAAHRALEYYYSCRMKGQVPTFASVQKVFSQAWQAEGFVSAEHADVLYKKGQAMLKQYLASHKNLAEAPKAVEMPFELHMPELKTVISGRYDLVLGSGKGVEIRDFKTSDVGSEPAAKKRAKDSVQLGIYALSWEKIQQQPVNKVSLEFINNNVLGVNTNIDHQKTLAKITKAVEGIKNMDFDSKGSSQLNFDRLVP